MDLHVTYNNYIVSRKVKFEYKALPAAYKDVSSQWLKLKGTTNARHHHLSRCERPRIIALPCVIVRHVGPRARKRKNLFLRFFSGFCSFGLLTPTATRAAQVTCACMESPTAANDYKRAQTPRPRARVCPRLNVNSRRSRVCVLTCSGGNIKFDKK